MGKIKDLKGKKFGKLTAIELQKDITKAVQRGKMI